ncbi:MAG: hypothetical protein AAGN46_05590 [Acidobacteriota bacterium]
MARLLDLLPPDAAAQAAPDQLFRAHCAWEGISRREIVRLLRERYPQVGLTEASLAFALSGQRPLPQTARLAIEQEVGIPASRWDDLRPHARRPPRSS